MVNLIWLFLLAAGIITGILTGNAAKITEAVFTAAAQCIKITLEIAGVMAVWMGILKLAEEAGLIQALAKAIRPLIGGLFPGLNAQSPAMGPIVINFTANLLGLGNAATPFGLKAMAELQKINHQADTATGYMITFLVLNTSSVTLVPALVISLRSQAGSADPTEIIGATILASAIAALGAVLMDYLCRSYYRFKGL